ncbi:MAG: CPBP family intramembrane metalloprotease [Myxococcales bacterium]|nr:CPBP family intramembrane metalloprotease [Myxococcales bacterium]
MIPRAVTRTLIAAAAVIVLATTVFGVIHIRGMEARTVDAGEATTLRDAASGHEAILVTAHLYEGTRAQFELCASDPMPPARWLDTMALEVRLDGETGLTVPLNQQALDSVRRNETSGCLTIGSGPVRAEGDYAIVATFEALPEPIADVELRARIAARAVLGDTDLLIVVVAWLGSMLLVGFLALRARDGEAPPVTEPTEEERLWEEAKAELEEAPKKPRRPLPGWLAVIIGVVLFLGGVFAIGVVAVGYSAGLAGGVTLAVYEAFLGLLLIGGSSLALRVQACGLVRPDRWWWLWFPGAALGGIALMVLARVATSLVPSTSVSSVQAFVSDPSGMVSFATLAVVAPLAEEVFFRGFVFGALRKYGVAVAFAGAWLTFTFFHGMQTFGQWGALVGIAILSLGVTTLRTLSKSVLVGAIAHLVYNGLIAVMAFL